ncbi:hypothetical protein BV22DRAFT_827323 [Leucogyrophana mollusca]|uniref:Uncharacterized protein n=1 Tax=Leucogyrophana mollusca TaxID=85980 RepID=A0ACB8B4F4_9AGAM|nr:hypothetical protein BV22DRAFT_827323 [Leucogyrophana mollusca]
MPHSTPILSAESAQDIRLATSCVIHCRGIKGVYNRQDPVIDQPSCSLLQPSPQFALPTFAYHGCRKCLASPLNTFTVAVHRSVMEQHRLRSGTFFLLVPVIAVVFPRGFLMRSYGPQSSHLPMIARS